MSKITFMFPGVGSQYSGMGKYFYDNFKIAKEVYEEASDVLKMNIPQICFSKEKGKVLNELENSQVILACVGIATYRVLIQETGLRPDYCIGYSLGEYTALCCANVIEFADTLKLVRDRGIIIKEVSDTINGTMAWTMNLDVSIVEEICKDFQDTGHKVYMSAYDCKDKASISATSDIMRTVGDKIVDYGGIMIPIKMSGPYHSPLMWEAAHRLRVQLQKYIYNQPQYTIIANRNAQVYNGPQDIVDNLSLQLVEPIYWQRMIDYIIDDNGKSAIEIGPKNVLTYLLKRNTNKMVGYPLDNEKDLSTIYEEFLVNENNCLDIVKNCLITISSTKNYSNNNVLYTEKVIKPYKILENIYKNLISRVELPNIDYSKEAIHILKNALKAKNLSTKEQQQKLDSILGIKCFTVHR